MLNHFSLTLAAGEIVEKFPGYYERLPLPGWRCASVEERLATLQGEDRGRALRYLQRVMFGDPSGERFALGGDEPGKRVSLSAESCMILLVYIWPHEWDIPADVVEDVERIP